MPLSLHMRKSMHALLACLVGVIALLTTPPARAADDAQVLIEKTARAVEDARSLRAEFTQEQYDPLFDSTEKKKGVILALRREGKPELARISFLKKLIGKRYRDSVRHYWAEDERLVEYKPRARTAKVFRRPKEDKFTLANPANAREVSLLFLRDPAQLRQFYNVKHTSADNDDDRPDLTFSPKQAVGEHEPKLKTIAIWIDPQTHLPRRCSVTKKSGEVDILYLDKLELNADIEPKDIVLDLPGDVMIVRE